MLLDSRICFEKQEFGKRGGGFFFLFSAFKEEKDLALLWIKVIVTSIILEFNFNAI
jgi:hypothetical protein